GDREPTRRDVLDVLTKLDPPEAYAPEEQREKAVELKPALTMLPKSSPLSDPVAEKGRMPILAILACVGGLMTLVIGLPASFLIALSFGKDAAQLAFILMPLEALFLLFAGLPACVLGIMSALAIRKSNGTQGNITCAAIGITAFPLCLFNAVLLLTAIAESM